MRFALFMVALLPGLVPAAEPLRFDLTFDRSALAEPFTGRVFVMLTANRPQTVTSSVNWFRPEPTFALDVQNWKPGTRLRIDEKAMAYPTALKDVKPGRYYVQAVMDRDQGSISFAAGPGNVYSTAVGLQIDPASSGPIDLVLDKVYQEPPLPERSNIKLVQIPSPLLSAFHGKPMTQRAAVVLPPSYETNPTKKYPIVYEIIGFSQVHLPFAYRQRLWDLAGTEAIWVVLDANCRLGHHVFADSANNGPVGTALVTELIPHIETTFRSRNTPGSRFVTGHSSGGWSSLWLQVAYPDTFGGCWSTSPDPVDFRDFQRVNLYEPGANLFTMPDGKPRDLSRSAGGRTLQFRPFSDMERLMGHGGQLESFEAVFSEKTDDGQPRKLWHRLTGTIDTSVAKTWEKYDIRLKLQREWPTIGPKLKGKIHVFMGDQDTFYLDGAAKLLKKELADLKSDAEVVIIPGASHSVDSMPNVRNRIRSEMAAAAKKSEEAK